MINFHRYIPPKKDHLGISRRMFLMTTAIAGVTTSALLAGAKPALAAALSEDEAAIVLRMTQDIYPHPDLLDIEV